MCQALCQVEDGTASIAPRRCTVFEELVRRFNEENNEEAGEHWTPRDAVKLMASLIFLPIAYEIESGTYLIYDGACGTGGMLNAKERAAEERARETLLENGWMLRAGSGSAAGCRTDGVLRGGRSGRSLGDRAQHPATQRASAAGNLSTSRCADAARLFQGERMSRLKQQRSRVTHDPGTRRSRTSASSGIRRSLPAKSSSRSAPLA